LTRLEEVQTKLEMAREFIAARGLDGLALSTRANFAWLTAGGMNHVGLSSATDDFPNPPVPVDELQAALDAYQAAKDATVQAEAAAQETYGEKDEALEELTDKMKANIHYAERADCAARRVSMPGGL